MTYHEEMRKKNKELAAAYDITGWQPAYALRNMVRALKMMPALNTPEENARLKAAEYILKNDKGER